MKRIPLLVSLLTCALALAQPRHVVAIAHRGEHLQHPENTIPAFEEAIRLGADFIEVDVQTTSDGKLVLSHDATVDRCTNGRGRISEMTFDQVESLDAGGKRVRNSPVRAFRHSTRRSSSRGAGSAYTST